MFHSVFYFHSFLVWFQISQLYAVRVKTLLELLEEDFFLIRDTDIGNLLMLKLAKCIPALLCLFPNFLIRIMIHYNHLPQRIFLFCHKSVLFSHVCYFVSACFFFKVHVHVHLQCTLAERFVSVFEILWTLSTWLKITASKDIKNNFLQTLNE